MKKKVKIEFISTIDGLDQIEECIPRPTSSFLPSWWKNMPNDKSKKFLDPNYVGSAKGCPSFSDYFSNGFVIPMWCDTVLKYDKHFNIYTWNTPDESFSWDIHTNDQFLNHVDFKYLNSSVDAVFKAHCPWKIITPPGYSVYQMPLYYHTENNFSVMPGIIDTDFHHTINQQVMILSEDTVFIPRGTPFVQYVPFERKKYEINVRQETEIDRNKFNVSNNRIATKFMGSSEYIKHRKKLNS